MYWARDEDDGRRNGQHSCRDTKKGTPRDESTKCAHTRYEIVRPPTIPQRVRGDFKNENSIARGRAVEKLDRTMREDENSIALGRAAEKVDRATREDENSIARGRAAEKLDRAMREDEKLNRTVASREKLDRAMREDENSIALGRADEKLDRAMREDENSIALRRAAEKLNRAMREDETPSHGASRRTVDRRDLLHSNRSEGRPTYSGWTDQRRDASGTPRSEKKKERTKNDFT